MLVKDLIHVGQIMQIERRLQNMNYHRAIIRHIHN